MGLAGHSRADLQAGAQSKLDDAVLLCEHGRYSNAYYLAGYSIELGLKACIAAQMTAETLPAKEIIKGILDHTFSKLVGLAGLRADLRDREDADPNFSANWAVVSEWVPDARYETKDPASAQALIVAIGDPVSGVFQWIKTRW